MNKPALSAAKAVISTLLVQPELADTAPLRPEWFAHPAHRLAIESILKRLDMGEPFDAITVCDDIKSVAPNYSPAELLAHEDSGLMYNQHLTLIRQEYRRRRLTITLSEALTALQGGEDLEGIQTRVHDVTLLRDELDASEAMSVGPMAVDRLSELQRLLEARKNGKVALTGVPSGVSKLDEAIGGFQKGMVTVVAGRPGQGKSAFALTCTVNASVRGLGAHVFSMEDTRDSYSDRVLSRISGVAAENIRKLDISDSEMSTIGHEVRVVQMLENWVVDDRNGLSASEIVRSVRMRRRQNDTQLVVVDYVQLLKGRRGQSAHERITEAMDTFMEASRKDDMSYMVLSQLNRGVESREDKRPLLSDLKESGSIEERSKCVLMLYRPHYYSEAADPHEMEIIIRKNSNGRVGLVPVRWEPKTLKVW